MGRYYEGDIEGKFLFGVQSSDDGEFFGAKENTGYIQYTVDNEDKEQVTEGIETCLEKLGDWNMGLIEFFESRDTYNEHKIITFFAEEKNINATEAETRLMLGWFARLEMGRKIESFFKENPDSDCSFEAEL